ncbi:MAG: serine hydrolase [Bacteroidota bacterium]
MKFKLLCFIGVLFSLSACEQNTNDPLLELIKENDFLHEIASNPQHEVQIIWTQVNRDSSNAPIFQSFEYNIDSTRYFYPASTVKLPIALLALEKVNELDINGLTKYSTFLTDSAYSGQTSVLEDSSSQNGHPSIAHYIKKIMVVSDNDAYNRLYEFLGQSTINDKLHQKGYAQSKISHRLSIALSADENRHTNPVRFFNNDSLIYEQGLVENTAPLVTSSIPKGTGYTLDEDGTLINEPFDFGKKNFIPLSELQGILKAIIFPESTPAHNTFNLSDDDYKFLYQYMSQLPGETTFPDYSSEEYYDAYVKFALFGNDRADIPDHIKVLNKIGQAYGYMIENAYIIDLKNNIEFMLSAVVHVNANEIYNDGIYEYDSIGFPFMRELGTAVYNYELKRGRAFTPNLKKFKLTYDREPKREK